MYGHIVLASTKTGFIPNAIKWFTQSQFSHSLITTPEVLGIPMCIEAAEGGVDFTEFDISYKTNPSQGYQVWNIKVDESVKEQALKQIFPDLEMGYGFLEYPWFIWRRINLLFGRDIKSQNNWNKSGMICSQLCMAYLRNCVPATVFDGYGQGSIAPQDMQNIFTAHPEFFELMESVRL